MVNVAPFFLSLLVLVAGLGGIWSGFGYALTLCIRIR